MRKSTYSRERHPSLRWFSRDQALPRAVRGPVDLRALCRLAAKRAGVNVGDLRNNKATLPFQHSLIVYHLDTHVKRKSERQSLLHLPLREEELHSDVGIVHPGIYTCLARLPGVDPPARALILAAGARSSRSPLIRRLRAIQSKLNRRLNLVCGAIGWEFPAVHCVLDRGAE